MKTKDIMTTMSVSRYLEEIMKIPVYDEGNSYNTAVKRQSQHCTATRSIGRYRNLCWREKSIKVEIRNHTLTLGQMLKIYSDEYTGVRRERKKLCDYWLMLGKIQLEIRKIEKECEKIDNPFLKQVVNFRYLDKTQKAIPDWTKTAKALGIGVNGEELRQYVCNQLMQLQFLSAE